MSCLFYNGKNFCLRGSQGQRNLRLSQLKRDTSLIDGIEVISYVYIYIKNLGLKIGRVGLVPQISKTKLFNSTRVHPTVIEVMWKYLTSTYN